MYTDHGRELWRNPAEAERTMRVNDNIDFGAGGCDTIVPILIAGLPVQSFAGLAGTPLQDAVRRNDIPRKYRPNALCWIILPRQLGLCPRVSAGAQRRVRRGPSLGESTPAGADNSRGTLHALRSDRPTMTAFSCEGWLATPALASLTPSESNVLRFKVKDNANKTGEGLC